MKNRHREDVLCIKISKIEITIMEAIFFNCFHLINKFLWCINSYLLTETFSVTTPGCKMFAVIQRELVSLRPNPSQGSLAHSLLG